MAIGTTGRLLLALSIRCPKCNCDVRTSVPLASPFSVEIRCPNQFLHKGKEWVCGSLLARWSTMTTTTGAPAR